jgi:hypothetical protein
MLVGGSVGTLLCCQLGSNVAADDLGASGHDGAVVLDGALVGIRLGCSVGIADEAPVGSRLGDFVGNEEGTADGWIVGRRDGVEEGDGVALDGGNDPCSG